MLVLVNRLRQGPLSNRTNHTLLPSTRNNSTNLANGSSAPGGSGGLADDCIVETNCGLAHNAIPFAMPGERAGGFEELAKGEQVEVKVIEGLESVSSSLPGRALENLSTAGSKLNTIARAPTDRPAQRVLCQRRDDLSKRDACGLCWVEGDG